jgi:hypothetical protein
MASPYSDAGFFGFWSQAVIREKSEIRIKND